MSEHPGSCCICKFIISQGVLSVSEIDDYFKFFNYKTTVMGASFRSVDEIISLNHIDILTISYIKFLINLQF